MYMLVHCISCVDSENRYPHELSTQYTFLRRCVELHTSTQGFHELENLSFVKKEAVLYVWSQNLYRLQNEVDYFREKLWQKSAPKRIISACNGNVF